MNSEFNSWNDDSLVSLGWNQDFQNYFELQEDNSLTPARVIGINKNLFQIRGPVQKCLATLAGRMAHQGNGVRPVTGDWVLVRDKVIHHVLPRRNALTRGAAGSRGKNTEAAQTGQVIAANLDTVFIVCGLDRDFNLRRMERYLSLIYNCGINPAIVLTKADIQQDPEPFKEEVEGIAFGVPVFLVSLYDRACLDLVADYLKPGKTIALLGSSGAGKSTLVNRLSGREIQATSQVSQSLGKGRHTTTSRDMVFMPQGGMVIDNPGIREIAFWDTQNGVRSAFPEIEALAGGCRFTDCTHTHEPGCRVLEAVADQKLGQDRLDAYHKMKREMDFLGQRQEKSADRLEKERWKEVSLKVRGIKKGRKYR
ncbi:ribosome small subunit-dependent GTPase A [Dethiosulfatarculus sandiegensis]|uniref:Small ribosomal subunit biogenesis GTPase RsgA n=1 Tax=Dethiosulfatarculus sandiegensis TaxID=1429043 RepID=A0A0D2HZD7_9BACT|nr:ribosome small subunit-dependent GTPase A [Dethiosulfatarculus sandiegensis]KIX15623.1 GTP-binding protein EngC [Dethiosulfatarculus sandiegensis]